MTAVYYIFRVFSLFPEMVMEYLNLYKPGDYDIS